MRRARGERGAGRSGRWSRGAGASRAGRGGVLRPVVAELGDPGEGGMGVGRGGGIARRAR